MGFLAKEELYALLAGTLRRKWASRRRRYTAFADNRYWAAPREELVDLAQGAVRGSTLPFVAEAYDCDDYAFVLKGLASMSNSDLGRDAGICLGIAWGRFSWVSGVDHAVNWAVDDEHRFWWIEPQNGKFWDLDECEGEISLLVV